MSFSLFFPLSECQRSAQEAEFCIFRGKNNTLISSVLMLVSPFFLFSSCLLLSSVPQTLTPFSLKWAWNNPCHTVNSGVLKKGVLNTRCESQNQVAKRSNQARWIASSECELLISWIKISYRAFVMTKTLPHTISILLKKYSI